MATDPSQLPLPAAFAATLDPLLAALGEPLAPAARAVIEDQARLLLAWSGRVNLTALRSPAQIALEHVADSLAALPSLRAMVAGRPADLLDLGSGAGYPGLPLAVAVPCRRVLLLDSIGKKVRFLEVLARTTEERRPAAASAGAKADGQRAAWPRVEARQARAEELASLAPSDRSWDIVTARAVASLERLVELAVPLLATHGRLVAWKRDDGAGALAAEIAAARETMDRFGARVERLERVVIPGLEDHRLVVVGRARRR